jgi:hypothetical protein
MVWELGCRVEVSTGFTVLGLGINFKEFRV